MLASLTLFLDNPVSFSSLDQITQELRLASEAYNRFRPKAHEFRLTYRESLAAEIAEATNRDQDKVLKDINHREERKEHFRQIRRKEKRGGRVGGDTGGNYTDDRLESWWQAQRRNKVQQSDVNCTPKKPFAELEEEPTEHLTGD